jgi:tRNA A-37 threonylcarbamoyl transferase component Bud32
VASVMVLPAGSLLGGARASEGDAGEAWLGQPNAANEPRSPPGPLTPPSQFNKAQESFTACLCTTPPSVQFALPPPGTSLAGRYRLERALGEGASSLVFAGRDLKLDRAVAIKLLKPQLLLEASVHRERFLNEARVLAKFAHPHVVPIFDVGETDEGSAFFVMELAGERTLARELEARGTLTLSDTLELLLPLMGALALAHDAGITHRDIKPANVVLESREKGPLRAKLLDFGIAKLANVDTSSGHALGTPAYMAPEQASAGSVGPSADVWALGVLFFRCLSGRLPFDAAAATGVLLKIVHERAARFAEACPGLAPRVALVLDQALEPLASARPQGMRELARRLAVACRQDGVKLPLDPDPLGLPGFAQWLQGADVEATQRAAPLSVEARESSGLLVVDAQAPSQLHVLPTAAALAATEPARERRMGRWIAVLLSTLIGVGLWVAASSPAQPQLAQTPKTSAPERTTESSQAAAPEPARVRVEQAVFQAPAELPLSAADAAPPSPLEASPTATPEPPPVRQARGARKPAARHDTVQMTRDLPHGSAPALIKQWDW